MVAATRRVVTARAHSQNGKLEAAARAADMTPDEYTRLFGPAVNWIGRYVSTGATKVRVVAPAARRPPRRM